MASSRNGGVVPVPTTFRYGNVVWERRLCEGVLHVFRAPPPPSMTDVPPRWWHGEIFRNGVGRGGVA
jgi:hypothetical protein